jgi:hypothetical protein
MMEAVDYLALHWEHQKEQTCALPDDTSADRSRYRNSAITPKKTQPRSAPIKVPARLAVQQFGLDILWRPENYHHYQFTLGKGSTILDQSNGLLWQQAGSPFPLTWQRAKTYVDDLNRGQFCEKSNWRIPTIDELITLLRPVPEYRALCIPPLFDNRQQRIWSADRRSFTSAYFADAALGFVGWNDFNAPCYVRAVCSDMILAI